VNTADLLPPSPKPLSTHEHLQGEQGDNADAPGAAEEERHKATQARHKREDVRKKRPDVAIHTIALALSPLARALLIGHEQRVELRCIRTAADAKCLLNVLWKSHQAFQL